MSTPADMVAAAAAVAEALRQVGRDPADQVRMLVSLASYAPPVHAYTDPLGLQIVAAELAMAALTRRVALVTLARTTASYLPSTQDEAIRLRQTVCDLLEAEETLAGDGGDLNTYLAFRALRTAVSTDLTARGAGLPDLVTFRFRQSRPSLALAYEIYGDAKRGSDLVARTNPPHPGFLPAEFRALSV